MIFVREMSTRDRNERDIKLLIFLDNWPWNLLKDSRNAVRFLHEYMLSGIVPLNLFPIRSKVFRLVKLEKLTLVSSVSHNPVHIMFHYIS